MPARLRARAVVTLYISLLLCRGQLRRFAWIETYGYDFVLLTDVEGHLPERREHPVQHLSTKHRAGVVDQRQHDRFLAEELAQLHFPALLVFENRVERNLLVQFLIDADVLQNFWQARRDLTRHRPRAIQRRVGLRHAGLSENQ